MTSYIELDLLASVLDLRSWNMYIGTHIYNYFRTFGVLNVEIGSEMAKIGNLTSNIDLDLPASKFDLRSWKMWRATFIFDFEHFGVLNVEIG